MKGTIVKGIAGFYEVKTEAGVYTCKARGIFKKEGIKPMVGDFVTIRRLPDGSAVIDEIMERRNAFIRPPVSNVDCFVVVIAARHPMPNLRIVDRFLVMAEKNHTDAVLCINKKDLAREGEIENLRSIYEGVYPVVCVSGMTGEGLSELKPFMKGQRCALAGPSGTGKSTLLNALLPESAMEVGQLSRKTDRGKHTTRHAEIFETDFGAMLFDTPGFTSFEVLDAEAGELWRLYPEMEKLAGKCRYGDCSHLGEPECAVKEALSRGEIAKSRYESYVQQYAEIKERREY